MLTDSDVTGRTVGVNSFTSLSDYNTALGSINDVSPWLATFESFTNQSPLPNFRDTTALLIPDTLGVNRFTLLENQPTNTDTVDSDTSNNIQAEVPQNIFASLEVDNIQTTYGVLITMLQPMLAWGAEFSGVPSAQGLTFTLSHTGAGPFVYNVNQPISFVGKYCAVQSGEFL